MVKGKEPELFFFSPHRASSRKKQRNESARTGKPYQINETSQGRTKSSCTHHHMNIAHKNQYNKALRVMLNFKHLSRSVGCLITPTNTSGLKHVNALLNMRTPEPANRPLCTHGQGSIGISKKFYNIQLGP